MLLIDCDLFAFAWSTASVLFASKPQLRKNIKPIPARYEREVLEDYSLTEAQRKYIAPLDAELGALGFLPFYTLRVTNYGSNLVRGYQNPLDTASCTLTIVEVHVNVNGVKAVKTSHLVNFTTRFTDGKELVTRNMALKSVMDAPEYKIMQECHNVTSLKELKTRHEARLPDLGMPLHPPRDVRSVIAEFNKEHDRFLAHQVQMGILRQNAQGDLFMMTDKVFNRGIRNYFNPFAKRISPTVALFSALVGAVLPLFGILKLGPAVGERYALRGLPSITASHLAILACYVLAGLILGFIAESQSYIWVMMITYIPAHLVAGWGFGWLPYSTVAFTASYFVSQAKRKRQVILQT